MATAQVTTAASESVESKLFLSVSVWAPGEDPVEIGLETPLPSTGLRWFDVAPDATPEQLFASLKPVCHGLEPEMLSELCKADELPRPQEWNRRTIRLASTAGVYAVDDDSPDDTPPTPSASALYQPVELVASEDWLISRWHETSVYRRSEKMRSGPAREHDEVRLAVEKLWSEGRGRVAGDLGVLVMHELALTYAPAHRRIYGALEAWELELYGPERGNELPDDSVLRDLWGARAQLRDWLNPLNVSGLQHDVGKAWLPATDHPAVKAVDDRIDRALDKLARLGETLRGSFHLLHIEKVEAARDRSDRIQRDVAIVATIFLIPTLIVGFYGANTWVPGQGKHSGFWAMVAVLVLLTVIGVTFIAKLFARRHNGRISLQRETTDRARPDQKQPE